MIGRSESVTTGRMLLFLNVCALAFYFAIAVGFSYLRHVPDLMFSTPDAQGYKAVADWIAGKAAEPPAALTVRPFLYPLILAAIGRCFSGATECYAIWFTHLVFWLLAINLTAVSVWRITGRALFPILTFVILAANVSSVAITFHALTESTVFLFLALWIYTYSAHQQPNLGEARLFILTVLLSLLTVVKPAYEMYLATFVLWILLRHVWSFKRTLWLLTALSPVAVQLLIMHAYAGTIGLSRISDVTLNFYYVSAVYADVNRTSIEAAQMAVREYGAAQVVQFLYQHLVVAATVYLRAVVYGNMLQGSNLVTHAGLHRFTELTNAAYSYCHALAAPVTLYVLARNRSVLTKVGLMYAFAWMTIGGSGISFWQGDRLVAPSLPLWVTSYMCALEQMLRPSDPSRRSN
jgi:hypothetical protein